MSTASALEIGILSKPRHGRGGSLHFLPDPKSWFARILNRPGIKHVPLTPEIAIDASYLPGDLHGDPGDRLLIATARHLAAPIVTQDRRIIDYAKSGWVSVIRC